MTAANPATAVVVLGARSGTSALAGTLGRLGCTLPGRMMAANHGNPKGYFEPQDLADIHDELLGSVGSAWDDCRPFPGDWYQSADVERFRAKLGTAYRDSYGDAQLMVVKEPRMCRLLPLWDQIFADLGIHPVFCFIDRDPMEVAASLSARDNSSIEHGLRYYIRNHLDSERDTRTRRRAFSSYDDLLNDWRRTVDLATASLGIKMPVTAEQASEVDRFLERGMRHQASTNADPTDAIYKMALDVHVAFTELANPQLRVCAEQKLDEIRISFDHSLAERAESD